MPSRVGRMEPGSVCMCRADAQAIGKHCPSMGARKKARPVAYVDLQANHRALPRDSGWLANCTRDDRSPSGGQSLDARRQIAERTVGFFQLVVGLQAQPEALGRAQCRGQADGGVGGDATFAQHDLVDAARRHAGGAGKRVLADAQRFEELLEQHFAGMDVGQGGHWGCLGFSGNRRFRPRRHRLPSIGSRCAIGR